MKCRNIFTCLLLLLTFHKISFAQSTQIRGFADINTSFQHNKVTFGFGEEDLFITSVLSDKISFLGESVFKFTPSTPTTYSVSIERIIINYNIKGNNNLIIGKIHTPVNYWNDSYHHGKVFFPTIDRPILFAANIIPLHTIGAGLQGFDLGNLKFGYDFFVGNGIETMETVDNGTHKSITAAIHIKPADKLRIGASWYHDAISKGAEVNNKVLAWKVNQNLFSGSVSRFGKKMEFLAEGTAGFNSTDTTGSKTTIAAYLYAGYKITNKLVPYLRLDELHYQKGEMYYNVNNTTSVIAGLRYEINYLAVVKMEYQYQHSDNLNSTNKITLQFAIGF